MTNSNSEERVVIGGNPVTDGNSVTDQNTGNGEQPVTGDPEVPYADQIEHYAGGHIKSFHGRIHWWLGTVYLILFIWALYYGFTHWGGLGPGLDY